MITQRTNVNLIPGRVNPRINVSQYDKGSRTLQFVLYNGDAAYSITSGTTALIQGTKPDGRGFQLSATVTTGSNLVTANLTEQMAIVAGDVICELVLLKGSEKLATANFVLAVEPTALKDTTVTSDSELPIILALATEQMENAEAWAAGTKNGQAVPSTAPQYHNNAKYYAGAISTYTYESEAWAIGKRNGSAVPSTDPTYHNNSKYYSERSSTYATNSANSATSSANSATSSASSATNSNNQALKSEGYAVGTQNGAAVSSGTYYHNNSRYYSEQAASSAQQAASWSAHPPYIGANGNWYVWNTTTNRYVDSGVDASITVTIADITMLDPSAAPYVTNTGTNTDPIFHLFIPRGKGIKNITKTGTSGLTDTYTITYSDNSTTTYTVVNGNGISGIAKTSTSGLVDTYTISYTNGTATTYTVANGKGISSITKTGTSGLIDTYTITYNSGSPTTFRVTNGKTAYQSAVEGGYTGTEQDFETDLANFETYATNAATSAYQASVSATAAADSATTAHQEYLDAKAEADRAEAYADFITPHFIIANNRLYIRDDAVGEFITANNRLYIKLLAS